MSRSTDSETAAEKSVIDPLMDYYRSQRESLEHGKNSLESLLMTSRDLAPFRHSVRLRIKSNDSMRGKLLDKLRKCKENGKPLPITVDNFFREINDSIGVRFLHLSVMHEFASIHAALQALFERESIVLLEEAKAYTWDVEYESHFGRLGVRAEMNARFYTSVHYIIAPNNSVPWSAEIQVRTLAEELWGEVDHRLNYPEKHEMRACRDQILALARSVGGCSRLVDSIFQTDSDFRAQKQVATAFVQKSPPESKAKLKRSAARKRSNARKKNHRKKQSSARKRPRRK